MAGEPTNSRQERGRYRKSGYVVYNGQEIYGLKVRPDGRHYAADEPTRTFGRDRAEAVFKFRLWQASRSNQTVRLRQPSLPSNPAEAARMLAFLEDSLSSLVGKTPPEKIEEIRAFLLEPVTVEVESDAFWTKVRELILRDPYLAAQKTGLPLHRLHDFREPGPSLSLAQLAENWVNKRRKKPLDPDWKHDALKYWGEFCRSAGVNKTSEITDAHVARYGDKVMTAYNEGMSSSYVKQRFTAVKAILSTSKGRDPAARRVLDVCQDNVVGLIPPADDRSEIVPITPDQFRSLLAACKSRLMRAVLLVSLNACYYPSDVVALKKNEVDFDHRIDPEVVSICNYRPKTGFARACCLWPVTVEAIQYYLEVRPTTDLPNLFVTKKGTRLHRNRLTRSFRRLRVRAGLPASVQFRNLRDATYTYATQEDETSNDMMLGKAKILAGHALPGVSSKYILSNPRHVKSVCDRVYRAFFNGGGNGQGK